MARWTLFLLVLLAGCSTPATPLRDNPAAMRAVPAPLDITQLQALEARVKASPEDLEARGKLLEFYAGAGSGVIGKEMAVAARRRHTLWLISQHPGHALAGSWGARLSPAARERNADAEGFRQARALWLQNVAGAETETAVLRNAALFFEAPDKALAAELYERLIAREPGKSWEGLLGRLYFQILVGSNASMPQGVVRSVSAEDAKGPLAMAVRKKLAASTDAALLGATGILLEQFGGDLSPGFDASALGREYSDRAAALAPDSSHVRAALRLRRMRDLAARGTIETRFAALEQFPEAERAVELGRLVEMAYTRGEMEEYHLHDTAKAAEYFGKARAWAERAVQGKSSSGRYRGHLVLGQLALRDGKRSQAVWHMMASLEGKMPLDDEGAEQSPSATRLAGWLLKDGERESVILFLERLGGERNLESAEQIRQGVKPVWYPS